ncbi:hypothetical protein ALC57_11773 [Trachymyrmex cornetzi]|uniref:HAT C-terminal dimerisation domain-containing protein n=1 Tax=Trachymyrmex cornetzi TaxID=471704 RepID=A0A151J210_9HYME|nr:hypothetical protein ALC57_11773 [Trachymyrmex cornetzi]
MASRETSDASGRGGAGKGKTVDYRQRKLTTETKNADSGKKVTFRLEDEKERKSVVESLKVKERFWEEKIRGLEEKIRGLEEKRIERENKVKEWIEKVEKKSREREEECKGIKERLDEIERKIGQGNLIGEGEEEEERSVYSRGENIYSRAGSACSGRWSEGSTDRLSGKEIGAIRKLMGEKEREERKCNIVIKGFNWEGNKETEKGRERAKEFIKEKIGVDTEVISWRMSGPVAIIKVGSEERKREIMINEYKLRGGKVFFENDLDIKIGYGRVKIRGIWKDWKEIEREEEKRKKENNNNRERNMIFWNTAGIINKDKEFWKFIGKFEFISLSETWLEEDGWKKIEGRLPSSHDWEKWVEENRFEKEIIRRERDGQRQWEESKLRAARYNVRYKEFDAGNRKHNYLRKENLGRIGIGEGVRGLVRLRCGNMEEGNKYWIEKEQKRCVFCGKETDCMEHYIGECQRVVTVASCERSFSKLKLIKTYLRSSMGQNRLTNLGILSIENSISKQLNYGDIIDEFASRKARKIAL